MIRAVLNRRDGGVTVLIGLSAENVTRMAGGEHVRATMGDLKLPRMPHDVVIVYGRTEADIVDQLRAAGVDLPTGAFMVPNPGERYEYDAATKTVEVHRNEPSDHQRLGRNEP